MRGWGTATQPSIGVPCASCGDPEPWGAEQQPPGLTQDQAESCTWTSSADRKLHLLACAQGGSPGSAITEDTETLPLPAHCSPSDHPACRLYILFCLGSTLSSLGTSSALFSLYSLK